MDEPRTCPLCGITLVGPFQPAVPLKRMPEGAQETGRPAQHVSAQGWVCPGCGLLSWYVAADKLDVLRADLPEDQYLVARPGLPYERRTQMLRLLRRVRRM